MVGVVIKAWGRAQHFSRQAFGALGLRGTVRLFKAVGRALLMARTSKSSPAHQPRRKKVQVGMAGQNKSGPT